MGAVEIMVMADQGSDGNTMPPTVFTALKEAVPNLEVEHHDHPHSFNFWKKPVGSCATRDWSRTCSFAYATVISYFCRTSHGV